MCDTEVCVPDKVPIAKLLASNPRSLEEGRDAEVLYSRKLIRINLTSVWDLAFREYPTFLDELVGTILHEYLHYFFHVNEIPQNEDLICQLSTKLLVLSLGRLIGGTNTEEDTKSYEEWFKAHFAS